VRVLLDHRGTDVSAAIARDLLARNHQAGDAYALLDQPEFREGILPALIEKSLQAAERIAPGIIAQARGEMASQLGHEFQRLVDLQQVNRSVRSEEIELLAQQRRSLEEQLVHARLRLDAIRIIQRGPA
jgi:ATP-dependent helicase HepA